MIPTGSCLNDFKEGGQGRKWKILSTLSGLICCVHLWDICHHFPVLDLSFHSTILHTFTCHSYETIALIFVLSFQKKSNKILFQNSLLQETARHTMSMIQSWNQTAPLLSINHRIKYVQIFYFVIDFDYHLILSVDDNTLLSISPEL